ncbi:MAG TPA: substrate-binding domain-containing protein, partial [Steroidobacteraceae bacterium]
ALLMQHAVDGVIWCPIGSQQPRALKKLVGPVVLIDRPRPGFAVVHSNYEMGGRLLAQYALRMGHTRVGLLSGPPGLESARQRRDGFVKAHPGEIDIAWEVNVPFDGALTAEAIGCLRRRKGATLIIGGNDLIAISAIRCLEEYGATVPEEVSVTGFDNIRWTDLVRPRLTTIAQPVGAIGARAVELMLERITGEEVVAPPPAVFDVELIERDSVKRLE